MSGSSNTVLPPPRLTGEGNGERDRLALERWMTDLYNALILRGNVLGRLDDHETRIQTLEGP